MPLGEPPRPGSMGRPLPGVGLSIEDGELVVGPGERAHLLPRLPRRGRRAASEDGALERSRTAATGGRGTRATASRRTSDGFLYFEGRNDDVIISAGYRIGPFEVESALVSHPAVAEAAAVAAPDEERGAVVRAVVVLRDGLPRPRRSWSRELQEHVKRETAPYKYPRIVEFAAELPKTASGKVKRAALRAGR